MEIKIDQNQYYALHSLLSELGDIEDTTVHSLTYYYVDGKLSKDNLNALRAIVGFEPLEESD